MNSYRKVVYSERPNKKIERNMVAEIINTFTKIIRKGINYIGLGSLECCDFVLFNDKCKIKKMISLEDMDSDGVFQEDKYHRFLFNKPLKKIELIPKNVADAFDDLPYDDNAFFWYDFDMTYGPFSIDVIAETASRLQKTSLIAVANMIKIPLEFKENRTFKDELARNILKKYMGRKKYPEFNYDNIYSYYQIIADDYLEKTVKKNNKKTGRNFIIKKIANYEYTDSITITFSMYALVDLDKYDEETFFKKIMKCPSCGHHVMTSNALTKKEKRFIDKNANKMTTSQIAESIPIDEEEVKQYLKYKKYSQ